MTYAERAPQDLTDLWRVIEIAGWLYIAMTVSLSFSLMTVMFGSTVAIENAASSTSVAASLGLLLFWVGAILTLRWYYLACRNLHDMGIWTHNSCDWAVAWFCIPFASLWKPYGVSKDLWRTSTDPDQPPTARAPIYFRFWWVLLLVGATLTRLSDIIFSVASEASVFLIGIPFVVGKICLSACGVIFLHIGRTITKHQRDLIDSKYRHAQPATAPSWTI